MTTWLITDGTLWHKLTFSRQDEIRTWLRMNGVDPRRVPQDSSVLIVERPDGWRIEFEQYLLRSDGSVMVASGRSDEAYVEECSVSMEIDPPMEWLLPQIPQDEVRGHPV